MPESRHAISTAERPRAPRSGRNRRRGWVVGGAVVVTAIVLVGVAATSRTSGPSYRTASVERADVDSAVTSLGTIQPINQANLGFPVAGTVGGVSATVGQHVTVGQVLAQLDTTSLDARVASAQAAVSAAQAKLAADEASQTAGTSTTVVAPAAFIMQTAGPPDPPPATPDLVTKQQARLIADQHQADQDLAIEQRDLKIETSLCQAFLSSADGGAAGTDGAAARPSPNPDRRGSWSSPTPDASGCASALQTVLADQVAVDHAQQVVSTDMPALDNAVDKLLTSARPSTQPQPVQSPRQQPSGTTGSPAGGKARSGGATGSPVGGSNRVPSSVRPASAQQLTSDQAAIDAAQAQLSEARQAHDQAELRSPIDGTVGSVTISTGGSVQGSSGTPQIVVIGPGSYQVITSVSDTNVGSVRVGDAATVTPSGSSAPLLGQVVSVGLLAASGSNTPSGSVSYPVSIGLTNTEQQLSAGQSASVSIMLAHASGTLTVPSSAVHTAGANKIVTVLRAGTPYNVQVTLGAIGPTRTQVLAGLNPTDQVILADLSQPLPTTNLQNVRRLAGGGGGRGPGG